MFVLYFQDFFILCALLKVISEKVIWMFIVVILGVNRETLNIGHDGLLFQDESRHASLRVVTLPPELPLASFPMPRTQISRPIAAGRLAAQRHPRSTNIHFVNKHTFWFLFEFTHNFRMDYLFLDSSFQCYKILFSLVEKISTEKLKPLDFNLFASLPAGSSSWQWL